MRINLVNVEDGIIALGFRKMSSLVKSINQDTHSYYIVLSSRSLWNIIINKDTEREHDALITPVAQGISDADLICFSSMSLHSFYVHDLIKEIRRINPRAYIIWGGGTRHHCSRRCD